MFNTGLFINDLWMHDSSRDLVLAGTQQSAELKLALDQVTRIESRRKRKKMNVPCLGTTKKQSLGRKYEEIRCGNEENGSITLSNDSKKNCRSFTKW